MNTPVMRTPEEESRIVELIAECDRLYADVTKRGGH
jgi:hypothetical protein